MSADTVHRGMPDASEASRRRRAVYQALLPFLPDDQLMQALWTWEENAVESAFALHEFAARLCALHGLQELRARMHLALVKCMVLPLARLGPDPWPQMQAARRGRPLAPASAPTHGDPAATTVFEALLSGFLDTLHDRQPEGAAQTRAWLIEGLVARRRSIGLDTNDAARVARWLNHASEAIGATLAIISLRRVLHAAYVLSCEYYGPVVADAALAEAVRRTEALPVAKHFAPRSLL